MTGRNPKIGGRKARAGAQGLIAEALELADLAGLATPTTLGLYGRRAWNEILATLVPRGNLAQSDLRALEMLCRQYEIWAIAERAIIAAERVERGAGEYTTTPNGHRQMSAERITANRAMREFIRIAPLFGVTPVARIRTTGTAQGDLFDWSGPAPEETEAEAGPLDPTDPFAGMGVRPN